MKQVRRVVSRKHRSKYLMGALASVMGAAPQIPQAFEGKVSALTFVVLTVVCLALAGISSVIGDGD